MPSTLLIVPVLSTLAGGLLALRFRRFTGVLLALGAGLLLGAAFLDLLPEAIELGVNAHIDAALVLRLTLLSFLLFFALDSALDAASSHEALRHPEQDRRRLLGRVGGSLLIFHSFRDGLAIGAAYTASHSAGYAVALGIAAHDLGDGMNTVILTTGGHKPRRADFLFLIADALAPFAGGLAALYWFSSPRSSVVLLALAAGFFIQMAAGDFLPQTRRGAAPRRVLLPAILLGVAIIYAANLLLSQLS